MRGSLVLPPLLLVVLAACASMTTTEQRSTQGPRAEDIWSASVVLAAGREPTFDERRHWDNQLDEKIAAYLRRHPEVANSLEVSTFRFLRQVTVGMTKEQVQILLGPPVLATADAAEIEKIARGYWPAVKASGAKEAWVYPLGWRLYFADARLVDITQYLERR